MSTPKRTLGLASATTIVVASMIGVGVYTTSGFTLAALQDPTQVVLAWMIGGMISICGAIGYSSLAAKFQDSGGEYLFLTKTVHPAAGVMAGWVSMLAGFTGAIAAAAIGIEEYLEPVILSVCNLERIPDKSLAIFSIAIATTLHCTGVRFAARVQDFIVLIKLLMLAGFIYFAFTSTEVWHHEMDNVVSLEGGARSDMLTFAKQLVWISFSYAGFNAAIYICGEVEQPQRNVPRAMILGTSLVTVIYVLLNGIFVYTSPIAVLTADENLSQVATVAATSIGGTSMANFVRTVIIVSLFTSVSAMIMTGPRVYAKMADDGVLPSWFSFQRKTPITSIVFQSAAAIMVISISSLGSLLGYLGLTLSLCSALTVGSIFLCPKENSGTGDPDRLKVGVAIAALTYVAATLMLAMLYGIEEHNREGFPYSALASLVTLCIGSVGYLFAKKQNRSF